MSVKLTPIQLDANTIIYVEVAEDIEVTDLPVTLAPTNEDEEEIAPTDKGMKEDFQKHLSDLQSTIFTYTTYALEALKRVDVANISKATLEFGVEMGGEAGIPYVTKGTVKSNLKIQVECTFDNKGTVKSM